MELTNDWIVSNFMKFNREYYDLELPTPRFLIVDSGKIFGQCGAKNWRAVHPDFVLRLSNHFERTEYEYQCTLLHEMIHLYWQSRGEWNVGHGQKFVEMAKRFIGMGWNIPLPKESMKVIAKEEIKKIAIPKINPTKSTSKKINRIMTEQEKKKAIYAQASVKWEEIWCTQTDTDAQIHCKFALNKMKDTQCVLALSFYPALFGETVVGEYDEIVRNNMPPLIYKEVCLNPSQESTSWDDMVFEVSFQELAKRITSNSSLLSGLAFEKEITYLLNFHINYDKKQFDCVAIFMLDISMKKKLFKKVNYEINCLEKRDFFKTPLKPNGECNDPNYRVVGQDDKQETRSEPKPIPITTNPLSEALQKLVNDRILSSADAERVMRIEFEINDADRKCHIPWNEILEPDTNHCLSDALTRLVNERYIRNSRRVENLIISLKQNGF